MADTIDFGIDLGTTNSAIAVAEDGDPVVIKSNDGWDVTPSAVWMRSADEIYVGRPALIRAVDDAENAATEFKREMGLANARRKFARAGVTMTPPQLSAEVLKSLRADAAAYCDFSPDCAVITVPAAFKLNQNQATKEAAALAGFTLDCPLVQEPTAAAFAYGFNDKVDRGHWLVFDFGGGTFDAAVVTKADGELRVLNHAGDPSLGGKDIDWAVVDRILAPAAARELGLADFRRNNETWRANFRRLKGAAEQAKIQLSRLAKTTVTTELVVASGSSERFEYALRRDELDAIAEPFYIRAIDLARAALAEASLDTEDIDRVVLVGGSTLAPGLRERLKEPTHGLGIRLDTSLDPTTVVAKGAAIFASLMRRPEPVAAPTAPGTYTIDLDYEPTATTPTAFITGKLRSASPVDWTRFAVTLSNPDGQPPFRSAMIVPNAEGAFTTEVPLDPQRESRFTIELYESGTRRSVTPDTVSIRHRGGPDVDNAVVLTHSLGIQLADREFAPLVRKGTGLPVSVRETFRTSMALRRGDVDAAIRIPVVQGEYRRGDRNREVGMLEIRPKDIRIDLPARSEVEITFEIDKSGLITVVADVPLVDAQLEARIDVNNVEAPSPDTLRDMMTELEQRFSSLQGEARATGSSSALERLEKFERRGNVIRATREMVATAKVDVGAANEAADEIRHLHAELDEVESTVRLPKQSRQLEAMLAQAEDAAQRQGRPADRQEIAKLRRRAESAIQAGDLLAVEKVINQVGVFIIDMERQSPDWPVKLFFLLENDLRRDPRARPLFQEGRRAIAANDLYALEAVNQRLIRLLPEEERSKYGGLERA